MGCAESAERGEGADQSAAVDQFLREESMALNFKVLLLGAGESGKSTVVKQLKRVYNRKLTDTDLADYALNLNINAIVSANVICQQIVELGIEIESEKTKEAVNNIVALGDKWNQKMPDGIAYDIHTMWEDPQVKEVWERRDEYWILDAANYYFDNVLRFGEPDFVPEMEDCIMARVRTTGIVVNEFADQVVTYSVVDVAGQRGERKKWIHCFDDVKCILFVVSLAGYHQVMFEDSSKNRMEDSMTLFKEISHNPLFKDVPIVLFLNKKDLFEEMVKKIPLNTTFPDYDGDDNVQTCLKFLQDKYRSLLPEEKKDEFQAHYLAARMKKDVQYAWEEVKEVLESYNKREIMRAQRFKEQKDDDQAGGAGKKKKKK